MDYEKRNMERIADQRSVRQEQALRQVRVVRVQAEQLTLPDNEPSFQDAKNYFDRVKTNLNLLLSQNLLSSAVEYETRDLVQVIDRMQFKAGDAESLGQAHLTMLRSVLEKIENDLQGGQG
jgi:hypothetical protein